jgi:hypothetical protein
MQNPHPHFCDPDLEPGFLWTKWDKSLWIALVSIRIRGAISMRIHGDPHPDQTLPSQKVKF